MNDDCSLISVVITTLKNERRTPEEPSSSCSRALLKIARVRSRGGWRDNATFKRLVLQSKK
jgi:hypothetical protein